MSIQNKHYDNIIIGAGLYGLYSAQKLSEQGKSVLILEADTKPFMRATYINQARVHMGYHYPRSLNTAVKSAGYFRRFVEDYGFCIHQSFKQIYATSARYSWTDAKQFVAFCEAAGIKCEAQPVEKYFKLELCDGAFDTEEYTYDAHILRDYLLNQLQDKNNVELVCNVNVLNIVKDNHDYIVCIEKEDIVYEIRSPFIINSTYAGVNQILNKTDGMKDRLFPIKYELCEIILCKPSEALKDIGITVMDGPFFSIMPFGKTGYHSLTAVAFTPHMTSRKNLPEFICQEKLRELQVSGEYNGRLCTSENFTNCNECICKPETAWPYMHHLADKYLQPQYSYTYEKSLFSQKPIMRSSEVDDSRPTMIDLVHDVDENGNAGPKFLSVLSGKINTVYDLDEYLV